MGGEVVTIKSLLLNERNRLRWSSNRIDLDCTKW